MAEPITIAQLIDASEDAQTLALFSNADAATQVPRRLADPIETLEYWRNYMSALATGKNGVDGIDAAITSMTVTTGAAGTAASVVTGGTPTARTFALTIPRGDKGLDGSFTQKAYLTEAAMIADKANIPANTSITVTNDTDTTKNGMYAYNGTSFTKSAYDPLAQSKTYTDTAKSSAISTAATDATTKADNAKTQAVADSKIYTDAKGSNIYTDDIPNIEFAIIDDNGNAALIIDDKGDLINPVITKLREEVLELQQNSGGAINTAETLTQPKTDLMHIFSYGQSLSRGTRATPAISTTQPYSNLTFAGGVLPKTGDHSTFKPLVEEVFGVEGETPTSGMLNNFVKAQVDKGDLATNWKMIGTAPGQEGRTIAELKKGTANYTGLIAQVQSAYNIAQTRNETYSVWNMAWTQGENDYAGAGTSQAIYLAELLKLRDDFELDVKAITKQALKPTIVMYQTAGHRHSYYLKDTMFVALAQLQAANENADIIMACPIYNLPHYGDNLHLTADSSYQLGRYYAKALNYSLFKGDKWQPLQPTNVFWQGKIIDIEFNKSGLVIDTAIVTATHNMGFDLRSGTTLLNTITSVTVTDSNRVRLVLSAAPATGTILSYSRGRVGDSPTAGPITGARGNLRDNAGDTDNYTDSKGVMRYMHNWCAMFEKTL